MVRNAPRKAVAGMLGGVALCVAAAPFALAQDDATVVYDETFFARYNLTNAEDLLRRIPGVSTILDTAADEGGERGFGSSGAQILLDGERLAGKSNDILATLRRIRASNVERVELIRGTSAAVDVQSEGVIVNVVLREGAGERGSGTWELNTRFNEERSQGVDGLATYSGAWRNAAYTFGVEREVWAPLNPGSGRWSDAVRRERRFAPDGSLLEFRPEDWSRDYDRYDLTSNVTFTLGGGAEFRLNGLARRIISEDTIVTSIERPTGSGELESVAEETLVRLSDPIDLFEAGGEYERPLAGGSANLLFIVQRETRPLSNDRVSVADGERRELGRTFSDRDTGEDILRGSFSRPLTPAHAIEVGGEVVRNTLEQDLEIAFDIDQDGLVEDIPIPTAHAEVEEGRWEAFAKHNWAITSALSLESALTYERSRITTNYPFTPERTYAFWKPRFDLRWTRSNADIVRFKVERTASQLNFNDFVPSYDYVNDEIDAGNPELAPATTWTFEAAYERRLPDDNGVIEARIFYQDISDYIDKVVIGFDDRDDDGVRDPATEPLISAPGNIDKAERYGIVLDASLRLTALGLRDAVVSASYGVTESEVIDPFTGLPRQLSNDWDRDMTLSFRHDISSWGLAYGGEYVERSGGFYFSDIFLREIFEVRPRADVFVEKRLSDQLTLRVEGQGITASEEFRYRTRYAVDQTDGAIGRFDTVREIRDRRFVIKLRGTF